MATETNIIINNKKFYCEIINTDVFETLQNQLMNDPLSRLPIISNMQFVYNQEYGGNLAIIITVNNACSVQQIQYMFDTIIHWTEFNRYFLLHRYYSYGIDYPLDIIIVQDCPEHWKVLEDYILLESL